MRASGSKLPWRESVSNINRRLKESKKGHKLAGASVVLLAHSYFNPRSIRGPGKAPGLAGPQI